MLGPRLVPIPDGNGTIFLVFGSGEWTWRALSDDTVNVGPDATAIDTAWDWLDAIIPSTD